VPHTGLWNSAGQTFISLIDLQHWDQTNYTSEIGSKVSRARTGNRRCQQR